MTTAVLALGSPDAAAQSDITVTTTADNADDNDLECTLREAILLANGGAANDCGSTGNDIGFSFPGTSRTITLASALPTLTADGLTINGELSDGRPVRVSGNDGQRVFLIDSTGIVTLERLEILNGAAVRGAGVKIDGGRAVIKDSAIYDNAATGGGGGIFVDSAILELESTLVWRNTATNDGGGLHVTTTSGAESVVVNSTISGNTATRGGGIHNNLGELVVLFTTVADNTAGTGAGIHTLNVPGSITTSKLAASIVATNNGAGTDAAAGTSGQFVSGCGNVVGSTTNADALRTFCNGNDNGLMLDALGGPDQDRSEWVHVLRNGTTTFTGSGTGVDDVDSATLNTFGFTRPTVDQLGRQETRPSGAEFRDDSGAYENQLPTSSGDAAEYVARGGTTLIVGPAGGLLATMTDPEGDPFVVAEADASLGTIDASFDGSFTFTPRPDTVGSSGILVKVIDRSGPSEVNYVPRIEIQATCTLNESASANPRISQQECDDLVLLYENNRPEGGWPLEGWWVISDRTISDPCTWEGIGCTGGAITSIDISFQGLTGQLPDLDFPNLTELSLDGNSLNGPIPNLNMRNLTKLSLAFNGLEGPIPNFDLAKLEDIDLVANNLTGPIPDFDLPALVDLDLNTNELTGAIPNFDLPNLTNLDLSANELTDEIPALNLPKLNTLFLNTNELTGSIPNFDLPNLATLDLGNNQLAGSIPDFDLPALTDLDLESNRLEGLVPDLVANNDLLTSIKLDDNRCLTAGFTPDSGIYSDAATALNSPACDAVDDEAAVSPGATVVIDVVANDGIPAGAVQAMSITSAPAAGSARIVNNQIEYIAAADGPATDVFGYQACSGTICRSATVTITPPTLFCAGKPVTINMNLAGATGLGTTGDDVILGTDAADVIDGLGGDDTICGQGGDDVISGGDGKDFIFGGAGNDTMRGQAGNDRIRGQQDADIIDGGAGNDFLYGGTGDDRITGGVGNDTIGGFGGADTIDAGPGNDTIFGGFGADLINAGDGADSVFGLIGDDTINGGAGNDTLNGDNGRDTINGNDGDDTINGGNSFDTLFGNSGDDVVSGGKADDTLSGGPDNDTCIGNKEILGDTADASCELIFGVP
jgi:CSLREA domain-containing protein